MDIREINIRIERDVLKAISPRMVEHPSFRMKRYTEWENVEPVLNWLRERYGYVEVGNTENGWFVNVPKCTECDGTHWKVLTIQETLPLALCIAAIITIGG